MYSMDKLGISRFGQWGVPNLVMAASNHIVAAIRELGTQWHQREIPSLFIYLIYHTNGNRQTLLSASCQALTDCPVLRRVQSWQYRDRRKPKATMPYSYFEWLQGFFIVHSIIGSTVHSMPLNSLEHCICTITMTNIRPDRDSNLVPPGYKPQSIRMSHRGRPQTRGDWSITAICGILLFQVAHKTCRPIDVWVLV